MELERPHAVHYIGPVGTVDRGEKSLMTRASFLVLEISENALVATASLVRSRTRPATAIVILTVSPIFVAWLLCDCGEIARSWRRE
jgi:hypothetical protein